MTYAYLTFHINSSSGSKADRILETVPGNPTVLKTAQPWCPQSEAPWQILAWVVSGRTDDKWLDIRLDIAVDIYKARETRVGSETAVARYGSC